MKCNYCNTLNSDKAKFCVECGKSIIDICPFCSYKGNPRGGKFCVECGGNLAGQLGPSPVAPLQKKIEPKSELIDTFEGARKQVTVFFSDIKGSTSLIEQLDPEETTLLLKPILDAMHDAVHKFGGTVIKTGGDGIMALFGAPIACEDHALRACHAALYLQKTVNELKSKISIRIGMNSGEVVVGVLNSDLRKEYDAMGAVVSVAARMEQLAEPNMIQLSIDTFKLAKDSIRVISRGKIAVKGITDPMEVFELIGIKQNFSRFSQLKNSDLSSFIGRQENMTTLDNALDYVLNGQGQVVGIVGEPGLGKSRLAYEFMNVSRAKNYLQYACQCQAMLKNNPFFPIKHLLKEIFEINDLPQSAQMQSIINKLSQFKLDVVYFQNICFSILGLPINNSSWEELSSDFKRQEIINGFVKLIVALSHDETVILLIEDMQWIDPESIECINKLIEVLKTTKLFLLITFRPEFVHAWKAKGYFTLIPISPLSLEDFFALASSILGKDPSMDRLKHKLIDRCYGNPFFLEEMIHSLIDHQFIEGVCGNYKLLRPIEQIKIPTTIQAVLDSRVDLLSQEGKKILKTCATIGKVILFDLLKDVVEYDIDTLNRTISVLVEKNFITKVQEFPEKIFSFKHDVILESTYHNILKPQKKEIHLKIVQCLERNFPEGGTEQLEIKADHAFRGEAWEKAFHCYMILQNKAHDRSASLEALEHFKKASSAYYNMAHPTREQSLQYLSGIFKKVHYFIILARFNEVRELFDDAIKVARIIDEKIVEAQVYAWIGAFGHICDGNYELSLKDTDKAKEIAEEVELSTGECNQLLQTFMNFTSFHAYYYLGNYKKSDFYAQNLLTDLKNSKAIDEMSKAPLVAVSHLYKIASSSMLGNFNTVKELENSLLTFLMRTKPSIDAYTAQTALVTAYTLRGDFKESLRFVNNALESTVQLALPTFNMVVLTLKGFVLSLEGELQEARQCLEKSYEIHRERNYIFKASFALGHLCEGFININCFNEAKAICDKMFELSIMRSQKGLGVIATRLQALIAFKEGNVSYEIIEAIYQKGIQLALDLEMLPEVAFNYHGLFNLYLKIGQHDKADKAYHRAIDLYESIGMEFWPDKLKNELKFFLEKNSLFEYKEEELGLDQLTAHLKDVK